MSEYLHECVPNRFGVPIYRVCRTDAVIIAEYTAEVDAERIAGLLTADDERIAREGHRQRCDAATSNTSVYTEGRLWEYAAWCYGISDRPPLPELDRLEAAYRAAVAQG